MNRNWLAVMIVALAAPMAAQQPRLRLDFPQLAQRASQVTDVSLDGAALKLGLSFISADEGKNDPDLKMLSRLQGIYVKSYEFDRDGQVSAADLAPVEKQLQAGGWTRLVEVTQQGHGRRTENDEIYVLNGPGGSVAGMAVLSLEPRELNVVNIVGPLDPKDLAVLGGHFGIPKLEAK